MNKKLALCASLIVGCNAVPAAAEINWRAPFRAIDSYAVKNPLVAAALLRTAVYGGYFAYCLQQMSHKDLADNCPSCLYRSLLNLKLSLLGSPNEKAMLVNAPNLQYTNNTNDIDSTNLEALNTAIANHNKKIDSARQKLAESGEDSLSNNEKNLLKSTALTLPLVDKAQNPGWNKKLKLGSVKIDAGTVFSIAIHSILAKVLYEDIRFIGGNVQKGWNWLAAEA